MSGMIEVMIDSVRVSLTSQQRIVLLRCLDDDRYLPIWIGPYEAESITIALQEIEVSRPQTRDLLLKMLTELGARVLRVEVVSVKEDVFYGNIVVEHDGQTYNIDARPSDSFALAVRAHVPIFIAAEVLDSAGIVPSPDLLQEPAETPVADETPAASEPADSKKRLSVFEDFLQNIDFSDADDKPDSGPKPDEPESPDKPE
jgi:bifunctional DNase/RNase